MPELWLRKVFPVAVNVNSNVPEKKVKMILLIFLKIVLISVKEIWLVVISLGNQKEFLINFVMHPL